VAEQTTLDHIVYHQETTEDQATRLKVVAMSGDLTTQDAELWRGLVAIEPRSGNGEQDSLSLGLFHGPDGDLILARAYIREDQPVYHYILLPRPVFLSMAVSIATLVDMTNRSLNGYYDGESLGRLKIPVAPTWTTDKRSSLFEKLLHGYGQDDMSAVFSLLGAALHERKLLIRGFPADVMARLELIQGLMLLLPLSARTEVTFSTQVAAPDTVRARVIFWDGDVVGDRWVMDMSRGALLDDEALHVPYVDCLEKLWQGHLQTFIEDLRAIELTAPQYFNGQSILDGLTAIADRRQLDMAIIRGEEVDIDRVQAVLEDSPPPAGELRQRYAQALLDHALAERDTDAAIVVARLMDSDTGLARVLNEYLSSLLADEPDAVYFFVRTKLGKDGVDATWLPLLREAAIAALHYAVEDGDSEILMEWLRLVAREPAGYELGDVLRDGIDTALEHAHQYGDLGKRLLVLTCKRAPDRVDRVLNDAETMAQMEKPVGPAFRDYALEDVNATIELGREVALVLLGRAAREARTNPNAAAVFDLSTVDYIWLQVYDEEPLNNLFPPEYQPKAIIDILVTDGVDWLEPDVSQLLYTHIATAENVDLFKQMSTRLAAFDQLYTYLVTAFRNSGLPAEGVIKLVGQLSELDVLTTQQIVNIYLRLIDNHNWRREMVQPYVEQIARLIQQNRSVTIGLDPMWQMLHIASQDKIDMVTRVVARRIQGQIVEMDDTQARTDSLVRLYQEVQWNNTASKQVFNWLRDFAHTQSVARLQQMADHLNGIKGMEDAQAILETSIAIKKALGNRSLSDFAADIGTAFNILQTLSDSFDPVDRQRVDFDQPTIRAELDAREGEITARERSVLAKNLKELSHLIIELSDRRSKATIMRRQEEIERQLLAGQQEPQSAIDTMKWLSGYLDSKADDE